MRFQGLALCIFFLSFAPAQASTSVEQTAPVVVRSQSQWEAVLASGQTTPLDALTPYGKRRFTASISWGRNGLGGFGFLPLIRELDVDQLSAALTFLDSASYLDLLREQLVGAQLRLPAPSPNVDRRLEELEAFALEKSRRTLHSSTPRGENQLLRRYQELFGERTRRFALQRQAIEDLPLLFDAAALADGESPGSSALADLFEIHREMAARGIDTRRTFDGAVITRLVAAREFDQAKKFASSRPHLAHEEIPKVVDLLGPKYKGRTVFDYDHGNKTLTRRALPSPKGTELVMVVDAGCHFSRDALNAIRSDAQLQLRLKRANLVLVTPPRSAISTSFLAKWNGENPSMPIQVPDSSQEWQAIDVSSVPEFFLLKDGALVKQLGSGWPAGGNKAALLKLLE